MEGVPEKKLVTNWRDAWVENFHEQCRVGALQREELRQRIAELEAQLADAQKRIDLRLRIGAELAQKEQERAALATRCHNQREEIVRLERERDGWKEAHDETTRVGMLQREELRQERDALAAALADAEAVLDTIERGRGGCEQRHCADVAESQRARREDRQAILAARLAQERKAGKVAALRQAADEDLRGWGLRSRATQIERGEGA